MSNTTTGLWNLSLGEIGASLKVLENLGISPEHFTEIRRNPDFAQVIAKAMIGDIGDRNSLFWKVAKIMDKNLLLSPEHIWVPKFPVPKGFVNIVQLLQSPCPFYPDKKVSDTHILMLGSKKPTSLLGLQKMFPSGGQPRFYSYAPDSWYKKEDFANREKIRFLWYLLLKRKVPNSINLEKSEQIKLLPPNYRIPSTAEEAYKNILYLQRNKECPDPMYSVRTGSVTSKGRPVIVGFSTPGELSISDWNDLSCLMYGIGAIRDLYF